MAETFNIIAQRTKRTENGRVWLRGLRASRVDVAETPLDDVWNFIEALRVDSSLSFADASLALECKTRGVKDVATEDGGFRTVGLRPLF